MLPSWLTPLAVGLALAVASRSGELWTGVVPGLAAALALALAYLLWRARGRPWHDGQLIVLLLPAVAAGVWIGVGGLLLGVERSDEARLLAEVGPGIGLTGLVTTIVSYYGRHRPDEETPVSPETS